jgi:hypothetical protein
MRVAFGNLLVSFGPVDPDCRHTTLVLAALGPGVYATVEKPSRTSSSTIAV